MNNSLYIGNLSYVATEAELVDLFAMGSGYVRRVRIAMDRETGKSRGFAFVDMISEHAAKLAIGTLNGIELGGRSLRVRLAEEKPRNDRPVNIRK